MNIDHPLVSVILCFYNEQRFIKEAIESVRKQTYPSWELVLVDDGSSDHSTMIAKAYALRDPKRIFYVHHEGNTNKGLSASRNRGIRRARGNYIALLDADDVWLPNKLENQLAIFDRHSDVSVILEASQYWNTWLDEKATDVTIPVGAKEGVYDPPILMEALYPLGNGAAPCPSGIIVRQDVFTRCLFEESFRGLHQMYEDQAFLCKVYLREKVYVSSSCHNRYRQRPASLVSRVHESGKYQLVRNHYLEWFRHYLQQHPVAYPAVEELLTKAQFPYRQSFIQQLRSISRVLKGNVMKVFIRLGLITYNKSW
jgi:glycosyltransferase involved in cell wall biosynthesis